MRIQLNREGECGVSIGWNKDLIDAYKHWPPFLFYFLSLVLPPLVSRLGKLDYFITLLALSESRGDLKGNWYTTRYSFKDGYRDIKCPLYGLIDLNHYFHWSYIHVISLLNSMNYWIRKHWPQRPKGRGGENCPPPPYIYEKIKGGEEGGEGNNISSLFLIFFIVPVLGFSYKNTRHTIKHNLAEFIVWHIIRQI